MGFLLRLNVPVLFFKHFFRNTQCQAGLDELCLHEGSECQVGRSELAWMATSSVFGMVK